MKSRAPQLHLEYRFYKQLVPAGMFKTLMLNFSLLLPEPAGPYASLQTL